TSPCATGCRETDPACRRNRPSFAPHPGKKKIPIPKSERRTARLLSDFGFSSFGFSNDSSRQGKRDALRALSFKQGQFDLVLGTGHRLDILGGTVDTTAIDVRDDAVRLEASLVGGAAGYDLANQHPIGDALGVLATHALDVHAGVIDAQPAAGGR